MLITLVSKKHEYTTPKGEKRSSTNFYLQLDNGTLVAIQPINTENFETYTLLKALATPLDK